jgi:uncharacterized protein
VTSGARHGFVIDSWAALALLCEQPAAAQVEELLAGANEGGLPLLMSVVNAAEVWYSVARRSSPAAADAALEDLRRLGIRFLSADLGIGLVAARFKASHHMSLADAFAAALAACEKAQLVTGDPEFRPLDGELRIKWL